MHKMNAHGFMVILIHVALTFALANTVPFMVQGVPMVDWGDYGALYNHADWIEFFRWYGLLGWVLVLVPYMMIATKRKAVKS